MESRSNYDELCNILNARENKGKTVLHYAAESGLDSVQVLLRLFNPGCPQKLKLLKARNKWNETAYHIAAKGGSPETLKYLLESIDSVDKVQNYKELFQILNTQTFDHYATVLHHAAQQGVCHVQVILELFKPGCPEILRLLKARNRYGGTAIIHSAAVCHQSSDGLKYLLEAISNNDEASNCKQVHEILKLQDNAGETVLHYAAHHSPECVSLILTFFDITDSAVPQVWSFKDDLGQTCLSYVTDVETLRIFKNKFTTDMWVEFVTSIEHGRRTWIHKMMMQCNKDCLDFILRSLSADVALQLLKAEDDTHSIPLEKLCDGLGRHNSSTNESLHKKELSKSIIILVMELIKGVSDDDWIFLAESLFTKTIAELGNTDWAFLQGLSTFRAFFVASVHFNYCLHILKTVGECVSPQQQLKLLGETNGLDMQL